MLLSEIQNIKMNINDGKENEIKVGSEFNKLNINHKNCYQSGTGKLWCKECVPSSMIEWTSGNTEIDKFIKDTIYSAKENYDNDNNKYPLFLEWVPFNRFEDIKQI